MPISHEELRFALEIAKQAAAVASSILRESYAVRQASRDADDLEVCTKTSNTDFVTKYDIMIEDAIIEVLRKETPKYQIISEERNPNRKLTQEPTWVIDPIDGTMAFVHGGFDCCIGIGLAVDKKAVMGCIACPFVGPEEDGEILYGGQHFGVYCNGQKVPQLIGALGNDVKVSPQKIIVCMNMPWRNSEPAITAAINIRTELTTNMKVRGLRSYCSVLFNQAQVALGRVGAYIEPGGKMWDVCAGVALIKELGGTVLELHGDEFSLEDHTIVCGATRQLTEEMAALCKRYDYKNQYFK